MQHAWEDKIRVPAGGGLESSGSEQGQVAGSFEHRKERLNSIQGVEFLNSPSNCRLLIYDPTTASLWAKNRTESI
jgi:hypothetical protein